MSVVTPEQIARFRAAFDADPTAKVVQNAVTASDVLNVALNREIVANTDFTFSIKLDDWKVTNQKRTWLQLVVGLIQTRLNSYLKSRYLYAPRVDLLAFCVAPQ